MMEKTDNNNLHNNYLKQLNKSSHKISKPIMRRTPVYQQIQEQEQEQEQEKLHNQQQQQQAQPPVYNINKSDFRLVVQKLTGSPAHDHRFSTPPPPPPPLLHSPKPQSSRLQRIRPPPLAHLSSTPPPPLNNTIPFSPLPAFPTVHAAAESPISAYMKYLRGSISTVDSGMGSGQFLLPNSPLAFGRIPSPKSPYPLLFSPTTTQLGFPQFQH